MNPLVLPAPLRQEFATVAAVWESEGPTRRVDSLLLCWVKYEKQLRRLFCFLVFQHHQITEVQVETVVAVLVANRQLNPQTFSKAINALKVASVEQLVGTDYKALHQEIGRIKRYRNKVMHGQVSGQGITSRDIERDVGILIAWVAALAAGAQAKLGYDGIGRNTYRAAKAASKLAVADYPFRNVTEFKSWLINTTR